MLRFATGAWHQDAPPGWTVVRRQSLKLQRRDHARIAPVAQLGLSRSVKGVVARGDDDGADGQRALRLLLPKIDGLFGAGQGTGWAALRRSLWGSTSVARKALASREQEAVRRVDGVGWRQRRREGRVDGRPLAQPRLEPVRDLTRQDAGLGALAARGAAVRVHEARLLPDGHFEIADIAVDGLHLAVGQHLQVRMLHGPLHLRDDQGAGVLQAGEGLVELGHPPAEAGLFFHQVGPVAGVGDLQGRLQSGDAPADDQGRRGDVYLPLLQRFQQGGLGHAARHQLPGLLGSDVAIGVHPGALFADVGHLKVVGVDPRLLDHGAECDLVHPRRAGSDDHPVQVIVVDVLLDHLLTGIATHVHMVAGHDHVGQRGRVFGHGHRIDRGRDIGPALADVDADPGRHVLSSMIQNESS